MESVLLFGLLIGYAALAATFLISTQGASRRIQWLGLVAIAAAAPFFYWLGAFSQRFDAGICYSGVVNRIANAVQQTRSSEALAERIRALPMRGYETSCPEVEKASLELSKSISTTSP